MTSPDNLTWRQSVWFRLRRTHLVCSLRGHRPELTISVYVAGPLKPGERPLSYFVNDDDDLNADGHQDRCRCGRRRERMTGIV
jgi:hypothetical protein